MIQIHITKATAHLCSPPEILTAGMAKAVSVEFAFSSDWDGLTKTAVFTNGRATIDVLPAKWDGDTVTVIKDLKIKGSSQVVKIGTKVKNIRLLDHGDHNIDCKVDGIGPMKLKSEFVKKV